MPKRNEPANSESASVGAPENPTNDQLAAYRSEILRRIERDRLANRFLRVLRDKFGFSANEIANDLLNNIFHSVVGTRRRLLASPFLTDSVRKHLEKPTQAEWVENNPNPDLSIARKARDLADLIEGAETGTPDFGLDALEGMKSTTAAHRETACIEMNKLPSTLRLYADYFDESRLQWQALGRIEIEALAMFQSVIQSRGQARIYEKTQHFSDERYVRLLNIALQVVGRPEIERHTLTMRRKRRRNRRSPV
jgi:hypothetical protein